MAFACHLATIVLRLLLVVLGTSLVAQKLQQIARERRWSYFELRSHSIVPDDVPASESYYGHFLDLRIGPEALISNFSSSVQRAVRKAQRSGLSVSIQSSPDAMAQFYKLHVRTRRRHGVPPQPRSFFINIQRHLISSGFGFIVLVECQKGPIAAAMFFKLGRHAVYKFGASSTSRRRRTAPLSAPSWPAPCGRRPTLRAGVFFAAAFFAGDFLAGAFLAGAFLAGAVFGDFFGRRLRRLRRAAQAALQRGEVVLGGEAERAELALHLGAARPCAAPRCGGGSSRPARRPPRRPGRGRADPGRPDRRPVGWACDRRSSVNCMPVSSTRFQSGDCGIVPLSVASRLGRGSRKPRTA